MSAASRFRVGLHQTDAAGVVFAAHAASMAHEAYERALLAAGLDLAALIREGQTALPLIRLEADYRRPMRHGQELVLETTLEELRAHGYRVRVVFYAAEEPVELARVVQVHACIDPATGLKTPLPDEVRTALERIGPPDA